MMQTYELLWSQVTYHCLFFLGMPAFIVHYTIATSLYCPGDNMLTALSVARECKMVDLGERIILVQAYPPQAGQSEVSLEFVYADDANTKVEQAFTLVKHF